MSSIAHRIAVFDIHYLICNMKKI